MDQMNTNPTEGTKPEELPITPGEAIKRYDHTHDGMMEHRVGYWVKHVDHNAAVRDLAERLEEELEQKTAENVRLRALGAELANSINILIGVRRDVESLLTLNEKTALAAVATLERQQEPPATRLSEEEIERIGREQYPPDTTNDGEPFYTDQQATRNTYFKAGLRNRNKAFTNSQEIRELSVDEINSIAHRLSGERHGDFYDGAVKALAYINDHFTTPK